MKKIIAAYLPVLQKYEIILAGSVLFLVSIILSWAFLLPNISKARLIFGQQSQLRTRLDKLKAKDKLMSSLDYQYYQENLPRINQVLPLSKDYVSLFTTFDQLQAKTGILIAKTNFQLGMISTSSASIVKTSGTTVIMPITLEVVGGQMQLDEFMKSLSDYSGRILTVDNIQLGITEDRLIKAKLSGNAYFYPPPATLGSIESPLPMVDNAKEDILKKIADYPLPVSREDEGKTIPVGKKDLFN